MLNFYNYLKNNVNDFIKEYKEIIKNIKSLDNPYDYICSMLKNINYVDDYKQGLYYYLLLNVSFYGIINYTKKGIIPTVNKHQLKRFVKKDINDIIFNRLQKFSLFLNTINVYNINIKEVVLKGNIRRNIYRNELLVTNFKLL